MAKENKNNVTNDETVGVNTPERTEEMDEKEFYNEDQAQKADDNSAENSTDNGTTNDGQDADKKDAQEAPRGFIAFVKKHWKKLVAIGAVAVVGGVIFVYFMGKTYKVDAKKLADVIPFPAKNDNEIDDKTAQAVLEVAKEMANQAETQTA